MHLTDYQQKVLEIYETHGYKKAWKYWPITGHTYGIFLGEVPACEFITGVQLINQIGLTTGVSQYPDTPWLKFILDDELIYVPMKPIMNDVSWEDIYQVGAIYGTDDYGFNPSGSDRLQNARVNIDGYEFKVTLLKGASCALTADNIGFDIPLTHGSEWNRLLYPIHSGVHADTENPNNASTSYNQWASYSDSDLLVHHSYGEGSYNWTQETHGSSNGNHNRLFRGSIGVTYAYRRSASYSFSYLGFRPALRTVKPH